MSQQIVYGVKYNNRRTANFVQCASVNKIKIDQLFGIKYGQDINKPAKK